MTVLVVGSPFGHCVWQSSLRAVLFARAWLVDMAGLLDLPVWPLDPVVWPLDPAVWPLDLDPAVWPLDPTVWSLDPAVWPLNPVVIAEGDVVAVFVVVQRHWNCGFWL